MLWWKCAGVKRVSCRDASIQSSQRSQREHPSVRSRAFPLSDLIDCTSGHVATCTQAVQYPQHVECIYQYVELHTPPRHAYSGPSRGLDIPLAASHRRAQLLLISWVTRRTRWASALGGTAADVFGGGGAGGHLVIVNIFAPPLPRRIASPSWETVAGRLELHWPCRGRAHAFSSVSLANIFHHRSAHAGCFEKSTV